jgi:hypothetical protein
LIALSDEVTITEKLGREVFMLKHGNFFKAHLKAPVLVFVISVLLSAYLKAEEKVEESADQNTGKNTEEKAAYSLRAHQDILSEFTRSKSKTEEYSNAVNELSWLNPAPSVKDLGLSEGELKALAGDRIVLMMHNPQTIEVPYYGEMVRWHNARFVSAITAVPMSAEKLRQVIIDNDQQDGWKKVEPFVRKTEVLYKDNQEQVGLRYKIQGKISIIRANGNVIARNRYEENGDISSLFLHADIGISLGLVPIIPKAVLSPLTMANVRRWEFIPIDENNSLVSITDWAEVMNDTHLSKRMSQYEEGSEKLGGISDEDLVGPFPGVAVNMYNFKQTVLKLAGVEQPEKQQKGETPDFINTLNKKAVGKLLQRGPVIFMHPKQRIDTDYGGYPLHFVTAAYPVAASFDDLRRYSAQMDYYADYVPQLNSSELADGTFDIPDFSQVIEDIPPADVNIAMSLGKKVKFISSFNIEYTMRYRWESPQRLGFEAVDGEIETVLGAVEWLPTSDENKSFLFYTTASDLGPNPKFPLNLSQKIPGADVASGVIVSVMAAGRQGPWVEIQLEQEKQDTAP